MLHHKIPGMKYIDKRGMQILLSKVQILNVIVSNTDQPVLNLDDHQLFEYFFPGNCA